MKDASESRDFFFGNMTIGLGHFRRQHDDSQRKGNFPLFRSRRTQAISTSPRPIDRMAGGGTQQCAQGPSQSEAREAANDFAPDTHASSK